MPWKTTQDKIVRPCCKAEADRPRHEVYLPHKRACPYYQPRRGYALRRNNAQV